MVLVVFLTCGFCGVHNLHYLYVCAFVGVHVGFMVFKLSCSYCSGVCGAYFVLFNLAVMIMGVWVCGVDGAHLVVFICGCAVHSIHLVVFIGL